MNIYSAVLSPVSDISIKYEINDLLDASNKNEYESLIDYYAENDKFANINAIISYLKEEIKEEKF